MHITRIQADGILGIQSVDVRLDTPIILFAGRNGSAKSSIAEAVKMAITQDPVRSITKKNQYAALVHDGLKAGGAVVTIDNDPDASFAFNMPKGDFTGPEITAAMRVALHGQRFAAMTGDERRTFLFELTKCKPNTAAVKARMLEKGCIEVKIDAVLPLLRTGFPSVCKHAQEKATEEKGAWKKLTGETYGPVKAESWEAAVPDAKEGDAAALADEVAGYDKNIAKMNESLGAIKNEARAMEVAATRRTLLAEAPAKLASITEQIALARKDLAEYEPKVEALRKRAGGKARIGLVHDMAVYISDQAGEDAFALISRYEAEHGKLGAKVDTEAQTSLPDHEQGLLVLQSRLKNLERDFGTAQEANASFNALAPAADAVDASGEVAEVEQMIATAKTARAVAENKRLDIVSATAARAAAATKTKEAKAHHVAVLDWTKVADALAPDGIPAELLYEALAPVNAALAQAQADTDWMLPVIGADMELTAAGRPYHLLSESEQWRWDAMMAQVVAEISGLKILMLDRCDVLDLPGRSQLFGWLDTLADLQLLDTALLFATFKALPAGLPASVSSYWVENGTIAGQEQKAAA